MALGSVFGGFWMEGEWEGGRKCLAPFPWDMIQEMERTGSELECIQARVARFLQLRVAALSDGVRLVT